MPLHRAFRTGTVEEERRLFYVGAMRARKRVYLFHARWYRALTGGDLFSRPDF
ncbi:MAG: 3'-5' exonuclease [Pseudomonadota bacterium]|uniref:3'-5' exonuclease n=1 Tax=Paraburkholderia sp. TaxID=1926495 RepID=UPI0010F8D318